MMKNFIQKYLKFLGMEKKILKKIYGKITCHIFQAIDDNYHFGVLK